MKQASSPCGTSRRIQIPVRRNMHCMSNISPVVKMDVSATELPSQS